MSRRIINEPTAAALAFGLDKGGKEIVRSLSMTWAAAHFDISIIDLADVDGEKQFEVLSTNGDTFLGGEDFDQRIVDYVIKEFKKDTGIDLSQDVLALQRLKDAAERPRSSCPAVRKQKSTCLTSLLMQQVRNI